MTAEHGNKKSLENGEEYDADFSFKHFLEIAGITRFDLWQLCVSHRAAFLFRKIAHGKRRNPQTITQLLSAEFMIYWVQKKF